MKIKNKIKRMRENDAFLKMSDIAKTLDVDPAYVYRVLTKAGLSTIIPTYRKQHYCKICNISTKYKTLLCSKECRIKYYKLEVTCSYCKKTFLRNKSKIKYSYNMGYKYIHCSMKCYRKRRNQELD